MAIELITGRYGTAHIGSEDVRAYQAYTAGSGRYVLHGGGATIQSANDVHLNPAEILIDGAHVRITGQGEDVTLENGASSYNRVDIVALHYLMTGSGDAAVESITLEVVKGTPSELTPSDPEMPASGSILDNVSETYVPYVRVLIQGLTPQTPEVLLPGYVNPTDLSGDGEQVNPSVLVNLASDDADTVFKASPRPGVTGTLPVSKGGTGATSAAAARTSLGLGALATLGSPLPVANGGTGATTADVARSNLGLNGQTGYLKAGRDTLSDLSWNTLYNLAPGTCLVNSSATNGPENGQYGNLLVSYSGGNRIVALLAYDNGHIYVTYSASASGTFPWKRISTFGNAEVLFSGTVGNGGSVTIKDADSYSLFSLTTSYNGTQSFVAVKEPTSGDIIALNGFYYTNGTNGALSGATLIKSSGNTYKAYCRGQEFSGNWWDNSVKTTNLTKVIGYV